MSAKKKPEAQPEAESNPVVDPAPTADPSLDVIIPEYGVTARELSHAYRSQKE